MTKRRTTENRPQATKEQITAFAESLNPKYGKLIYKAAFKVVKTRDDANDVAQETLLKLFQKANELCLLEEKVVKVYVYRAARNTALTYIGHNAEPFSLEDLTEAQIPRVEETVVTKAIEDKERREVLLECIDKLTAHQKDMILCKYFDDWDNKLIADLLGISTGGVRVLQKRAFDKLKKLLRAKGVEYDD